MKIPKRSAAYVLIVLLGACTAQPAAAVHDAAPAVDLTTVRAGPYTQVVNAVGRVGAPAGSESKLAFTVPGVLQSVDVRIGEHVGAGQSLASLDTSGLTLAVQQAQADARAAAANAQQSAVDRTSTRIAVDAAAVRREESLYAAGVAAFKNVQAARAQLAQDRADAAGARAQVSGAGAQAQSAQARAAIAQRDLANGTLRAPADGVVTAIYKHPGESVDPAAPVLAVSPGSAHDVTLAVSPSDAAGVHAGNAVTISIPGTSMRSAGRVIGVSPALDPATQAAIVIVSGVPSGAPQGSAVQAVIDVANDRGIVIPQSAIVQDPQSGDTLVFVQQRDKNGDLKFNQRKVIVDRQNGTQVLIKSGLRPGDRIASQGAFALLAPAGGG